MRRATRTTGALVLAAATSFAFAAGGRVARADSSYTVSAAADGVWTTVDAPGILPLGVQGNGGGPTAQAAVDSLGNSTGFAASPDPGDAVLSVPQVLAAFPVPIPQYPLMVSSSSPHHPTASSRTAAGALSASSSSTASHAAATSGGASSPAAAPTATAAARSDTVIRAAGGAADASSTVDGVSFQGVLAISHVHAEAHAARTSDGRLTRSSKLEVGAATVAGVPVTITDRGVVAGGSTVPVSPAALDRVLAAAGLAVTVVPASQTPSGVVAPAVKVTLTQTPPLGGPIRTTYLLGFASASVATGPLAGGQALTPPLAAASSASPPAAMPPDNGATAGTPATGEGAGTPSPAMSASQLPSPAGSPPVATRLLHGQPAAHEDAVGLYLILVFAALATIGAAQLVRLMGVRSAWTS